MRPGLWTPVLLHIFTPALSQSANNPQCNRKTFPTPAPLAKFQHNFLSHRRKVLTKYVSSFKEVEQAFRCVILKYQVKSSCNEDHKNIGLTEFFNPQLDSFLLHSVVSVSTNVFLKAVKYVYIHMYIFIYRVRQRDTNKHFLILLYWCSCRLLLNQQYQNLLQRVCSGFGSNQHGKAQFLM